MKVKLVERTEVWGGRKVKVLVPVGSVSKEELERLVYQAMKEAWEKRQKERKKRQKKRKK